jgi:hypothetical protein
MIAASWESLARQSEMLEIDRGMLGAGIQDDPRLVAMTAHKRSMR